MISVKLLDIIDASPILRKLAESTFSGAVAFKIARLIKACEIELQTFEESRRKIIEEYGEKDENGELKIFDNQQIKVKEEYREKCAVSLNELLNTEIELNVNKIPINSLEQIDITPNELIKMEAFIEE